jgi:hypothetical protein
LDVGEAEVAELEIHRLIQQKILELEVAVTDAATVEVLNCLDKLTEPVTDHRLLLHTRLHDQHLNYSSSAEADFLIVKTFI